MGQAFVPERVSTPLALSGDKGPACALVGAGVRMGQSASHSLVYWWGSGFSPAAVLLYCRANPSITSSLRGAPAGIARYARFWMRLELRDLRKRYNDFPGGPRNSYIPRNSCRRVAQAGGNREVCTSGAGVNRAGRLSA